MRHHRLLELFLAESLGMPWDRVHAEAEVLEHVLSEELEELIAARLGDPTRRPARRSDPDRASSRSTRARRAACSRSSRARAGRSRASPTRTRTCCGSSPSAGSRPGDALEVVDKQPFDGPLFVRFGDEVHVLGGELARAMRVELDGGERAAPPAAATSDSSPTAARLRCPRRR